MKNKEPFLYDKQLDPSLIMGVFMSLLLICFLAWMLGFHLHHRTELRVIEDSGEKTILITLHNDNSFQIIEDGFVISGYLCEQGVAFSNYDTKYYASTLDSDITGSCIIKLKNENRTNN